MSGPRKLLQTQPTVDAGEGVWTLTNVIEQYDTPALNRNFSTFGYGYNGMFFKPDGTKLYIHSDTIVYEFDLSTAWDQETATFVQSLDVSGTETSVQGIFFAPDGLNMFIIGVGTDTVYNFFLSTPWDISTALQTPIKSVSAEEAAPQGLFFKPDGTKMYIIGTAGDEVNEYDLSIAWSVTSAVFLQSFSVAARETAPNALFFKPDGLTMYIIGSVGDDVNQFNLSTAWDISTAVYSTARSFSVQESVPHGLFFKPDGSKMYIIGTSGDDVNEYDLSTPWLLSSAVYSQVFSVRAQDSAPFGLFFKPDGTKMYVIGTTDFIREYNLSTAWDVSSAVYSQAFSVAAQQTNPGGLFFAPDGLKVYVVGYGGATVTEYGLTVAWDISTASATESFNALAQEATPQGLFFKPDGSKMYIIGAAGDDVNEYDLSIPWNVLSAEFLQVFSVAAQETFPTDISFKADGTKMYILGDTGNDVNEYDLSTAWDISTASYLQNFSVALQTTAPYSMTFKPDGTILYINGSSNYLFSYVLPDPWNITSIIVPDYFSVSAQESNPHGLFFKPDGSKMYVIGVSGDDVNEYDLSIPWDVNSAVFLQLFSVAAEQITPSGLFFKPEGTKMYIIGNQGDEVNEYDLSTAWDVSTASYVQVFIVTAQEANPQGLFFKPDGSKMYAIGYSGDDVNEYNLGTAWDVSTASYLQNFSVAAQETQPTGIFFKPDGLKMFITGVIGDSVYEYDLSTEWDISTASYLQSFRWVGYWEGASNGAFLSVFFKPDGNKIYILGESAKVYMVDL
jgi:6-phosphogluconolactonase (cycloisomerase 2 family)